MVYEIIKLYYYATRSTRHSEGSQRPQGRLLQSIPAADSPRHTWRTESHDNTILLCIPWGKKIQTAINIYPWFWCRITWPPQYFGNSFEMEVFIVIALWCHSDSDWYNALFLKTVSHVKSCAGVVKVFTKTWLDSFVSYVEKRNREILEAHSMDSKGVIILTQWFMVPNQHGKKLSKCSQRSYIGYW